MAIQKTKTQTGGRPPRPEPVADWVAFNGLLDAVCEGMGFDGGRLVRWSQLAERMGFESHNYFHRFNKGGPSAPSWLTCWRLAEVSGIDLAKWYRAAGLLPDHLTTYGRPTAEADAERDLDRLRTLETEFGEGKAGELIRSAARIGRAHAQEHTSPSRRQPQGPANCPQSR